ncbi:hypothetical protein GF348_24370 [candidate division KSB3 bacterium]|nr:hypothetical protein [candidate division KSB3 bacterium]
MSDEQIIPTGTLEPQEAHSDITGNKGASTEREKDTTIQFLLTEFSEMGEFWRHTDSRIETAINFYLTVGAAALPGTVILYEAVADLRLFVIALLPIMGALFIFGFFLVRRITSADIKKAEYLLSLNLVRRYFVDHSPKVARYLYMPLAQPSESSDGMTKQVGPVFHRRIAFVVNTANSVLAGTAFSGLLWLVSGRLALCAYNR